MGRAAAGNGNYTAMEGELRSPEVVTQIRLKPEFVHVVMAFVDALSQAFPAWKSC